ncbi:hypothetical protein AB6806_26070 [Bosea sp. RCC_152_1]|uniref:hypothetical protein n=1 Tax=Bosea sp. RCC_152_1 TaxID=3239228 RepID=UPI003523FBDC
MNFDHEPGAQLASDFQKCPRTFAQNRWASGEGVVRKHAVTRPKADPIGALGIGKLRDKSRRLPLNIQQYRRTAASSSSLSSPRLCASCIEGSPLSAALLKQLSAALIASPKRLIWLLLVSGGREPRTSSASAAAFSWADFRSCSA